MISLHHGDCLEIMTQIKSSSIDFILADPPYGKTSCKWDSVIPLEPMWEQLKRIAKPNAAIVLTAAQPFTTTLIASNLKNFKYEWVWIKSRRTGFLQAKYMPMKSHETVLVFCYNGKSKYFPQKTTGHTPTQSAKGYGHSATFGASKERNYEGGDTDRYPLSVQSFKSERGFHPTQKPVALMEYMIKTYSNESDTILDFTMGSGTTGVACQNLKRKFVGIELEQKYFQVATKRLNENEKQND